MKPFTGRQERGVGFVPSFQFVERDLRAAFDEHAWAAKLAFEKRHIALPIPANAVFRPAIRAPSMKDVALGRVEVQRARPILVTERTGAVRVRVEKGACPRTNAFAHLRVHDKLDFERVRPRLFGVGHRHNREYASRVRYPS